MNLHTLTQLGLTDGEIKIYQVLLEQGPQSIASLLARTGLKKGDCYNKIYSLVEKGLVEAFESDKKKHFRLSDPRKLEDVAARHYQQASQVKREVESLLPQIISTYTLAYHSPGAIFFEGEEAMRRVLEDTLTASGEVLQYTDVEAFTHQFPKVNADYVKRRRRLKQVKRVLAVDTPGTRRYALTQQSEYFSIRYLPEHRGFRNVSMYLYDNKISYLTLQQDRMVGVIIEDPLIAAMHHQLFEFAWTAAG